MMLCLVCGLRPIQAARRCNACYLSWWRSQAFEPTYEPRGQHCRECEQPATRGGRCRNHYMRMYNKQRRELRGR